MGNERRGILGAARTGSVVMAVFVVLAIVCSGSDDGDGAAPAATVVPPAATAPPTSAAAPAALRTLTTVKEPAADLPGYNVYRPVDLDATGGPLPVIVWANGGCYRWDATWSPLLEGWAAKGFVVVAVTLPVDGSSPLATTSADDQAKAIDWAEAQQDTAGGALAGHLDTDRMVAAGNSCGGITSLALAGRDPRVRAVFVLSGSSIGPGATREMAAPVMAKVTVPVGFVVGGPEDIARPQATQDFELLAAGIPAFIARRASGEHPKVSTDPAILADVAEISANWMDFALTGNEAARQSLETQPCRACTPDVWTVESKSLDVAPAP